MVAWLNGTLCPLHTVAVCCACVQCEIKLEVFMFSFWIRHWPKEEQKQDQDQEKQQDKKLKNKLRREKNRSKSNILEAGEGFGHGVVYCSDSFKIQEKSRDGRRNGG